VKRAHAFPLLAVRKACRIQPRLAAELPVTIEELWVLNYRNFADSQYAAVQDKGSKIAERPARGDAGENLSWSGAFSAINLLKMRAIRVINCRPARRKIVRDIL
jgi:hypothetical protein